MTYPATLSLSFPTILSILVILHYTIFCTSGIPCPDAIGGECGRCTSNDDPHIKTFDNMYYDNHQPLCYKYITGCPNNVNYIPFEIYLCHYYCWRNRVACVGDISVAFFDELGNTNFHINIVHESTSAADALTDSVLVDGNSYTFDTSENHQFAYENTGFRHIFNIYSGTNPSFYAYISHSSYSLQVFLSESYFQNKICGLCGSFDGVQTNELLGSDGIQYLPADITPISYTWSDYIYLSRDANSIINDFSSTYVHIPPTSPTTAAPTSSPTTAAPTTSPLTSAPTFTKAPTADPTTITELPTADPTDFVSTTTTTSWGDDCCFRRRTIEEPTTTVLDTDTCCARRRLQNIECRNSADACCGILWTEVTSTAWDNRIVDEATARIDWIEGCIRDVCLLTNDTYALPCNTSDFMFSWATDLAVSTAQDTYPILRTSNTDAIGDDTTGDDTTNDDSSSSSGSSSDSAESMHIYAGKLVGNNEDDIDDIYTINILFSNSLWYVIIGTVMLVGIVVFWMCWIYKRNDNTTKGHIESDSSDVDQSNLDKV